MPRVQAPSPVNFYNYADETSLNSPITVQLFLNDLTVSNRQIRLKTYFEGGNINFTSKDFVIGAENIFIEGGIPLTLKNTELAPYYKLENLQGISNTVYGRSIPEGSYNFCFEVFDFLSGAKLSAKECRTVFIFKNEPPILNIPLNGTNIKPSDFENIVFQWTPRHINVSNVEYEFSLVEIWDDAVNPQTAFLSQTPIYEETTRATTLIYGPDKPLLLPEKRYAWRIKAKALQGLEEIGLFKNQGFSEVFWFSRTAPCMVPENISAEPKGLSKINIFWDQDPTIHSEYVIAYREADKEYAKWFTKRTNSAWATIWNLKPGTKYEYKIKGKCTYQFGEYSKVKEVTTDIVTNDEANYNCGIVPDHIAISNREPHPNLRIGDEVTAGDFLVVLTNITSQSNGRISGVGYVAIPYLNFAKFSVYYENVLINTDNQLAEGEIVTLYDPEFGENASMTVDVSVDVTEGVRGDSKDKGETVEVGFIITGVEIDANGAIVITGVDENGKPDEAIIPGNEDVSIRSANGDVWEVGEDGKITEKEGAEGGAVAESTTNGLDADGDINAITAKGVKVYFEDSGYYSFDALPNGNYATLEKEYKILNSNSGKYKVPYKAISDSNGKDFINARVEITDTDIVKDSIIFKTKAGAKVPVLSWNGNIAKLSLERKFDYVNEEILAVIRSKKDTTKFDVAGNLITTHLASQELEPINITVVPIFESLRDSQLKEKLDALKKEVEDIYKKAGVKLNIQFKSNVLPEDINGWNNGDRITVGDSDVLSNYTASEKIFNNYIKQQSTYIKNTYYVFLTDLPTTKAVKGFMPLKRQFGFVFDAYIKDEKERAKTMAHELGHGIFGLEHPWKEYKTPQGATNFLMDYGEGTLLNHMDWKKIHASGIKLYLFQSDEDGENGNGKGAITNHIMKKMEELRVLLNDSKIITITHCESCSKNDNSKNRFVPIPESDLDNHRQSVKLSNTDFKLVHGETAIKKGGVCLNLYYSKVSEQKKEIKFDLSPTNTSPDEVNNKLWVFDDKGNKYNCTNELKSWSTSSVICEMPESKITNEYIENLLTHLNSCGPEFSEIMITEINKTKIKFNNHERGMETLLGNSDSPKNMVFDLTTGGHIKISEDDFKTSIASIIKEIKTLSYNEAIYFAITDSNTPESDITSFYNKGKNIERGLIVGDLNISHIELFIKEDGSVIFKKPEIVNSLNNRNTHFEERYNTIYSNSENINANKSDEVARRVAAKFMRSSTKGGLEEQVSDEDFSEIFNNFQGALELQSTIDIIKEYLKSKYPEQIRSNADNVNGEDDIVFLINHIVKRGDSLEALSLLSNLFEDVTIDNLIDQFSGVDLWVADGNYDKLAGAIFKLWTLANPNLTINDDFIQNLKDNKKIFPVGSYGVFASDQGNCTPHYLSPEFRDFEIKVSLPSRLDNLDYCTAETYTTTIESYKEPVGLYITSPIVIGGQTYNKGTVIVVPAFLLFQIRDEQYNQRIANFVEITADVALTFTGIGNLTKLKTLSGAAKAIAIYEVASSTIDIAARIQTEIAVFEGDLTPQEANNIKTVTGILTAIAGVAEISYKGRELFLNYINKNDEFIKASSDVKRVIDNFDGDLDRVRVLEGLFNVIDATDSNIDLVKLLRNKGHKFTDNLDFTGYGFNTSDSYIDIIIHSDDTGSFILKVEGKTDMVLSKVALGKIMDEIPSEKEVRLLSCNSDAAAVELSKYTDRAFYASDGVVTIYKNGKLVHTKPFRKYHKGARSDVGEIPPSTKNIEGKSLRLGDDLLSNLKTKFVNKLNTDQWNKFKIDFENNLSALNKFDENPKLVDSWKVLDDARVDDVIRMDIKMLDIVNNLSKKNILDVTEITKNAKKLESADPDIISNLQKLTKNIDKYDNPDELNDFLKKGLDDFDNPQNPSLGFKTELDEALKVVNKGDKVRFGYKNSLGNEIDVHNISQKWIMECKHVTSGKTKGFNNRVKAIGQKFNDNRKLDLSVRDFFKNNGGLFGKIDISNTTNPMMHKDKSGLANHIKHKILGDPKLDQDIKDGLNKMKELIIKNNTGEHRFIPGVDF